MAPRYANATEILPAELLAAVREKVGKRGGFLWVPSERTVSRERRNEFVVRLYAEGHSSAAIAERLFISQRTVFRVLARAKTHVEDSSSAVEKEDANGIQG